MNIRSIAVCGIMLVVLAGCSKAKESYETKFKETFKQSFVKSCVESAVKAGRNESDARPKCECVAQNLAEKHSSADLMKLASSSSPGQDDMLIEAVNSCK